MTDIHTHIRTCGLYFPDSSPISGITVFSSDGKDLRYLKLSDICMALVNFFSHAHSGGVVNAGR